MSDLSLRRWNTTAAYAFLQGATWSFYAVILSFSSNVLYDFGFSDSQISLFLGIFTALAFALQLAGAELVSRNPKFRVYGLMLLFGGVMLISSALLLLPHLPRSLGIAAFALACMVLQMIPSFTNAMGMDSIKRGAPTNYSLARGMGSLAYSLAALVTGMLVRSGGTRMVSVLSLGVAAVLLLSALWYHLAAERDLPQAAAPAGSREETGFLRKYPRFTVLLAGAVFLCISHNLLCNFMYQIMLSRSAGAGEQGVATAISALVELPVMFGFPLLLRRFRCDRMVRFSALCLTLKAVLILLAPNAFVIYLAQATQMIGYGLYVISSVNYAEMIVGEGESVRAQSYLGSTTTVGALIALSTGGVLCEVLSVNAMILASLLCSLVGGVTVALAAQKTPK